MDLLKIIAKKRRSTTDLFDFLKKEGQFKLNRNQLYLDLKELKRAGILSTTRNGRWIINPEYQTKEVMFTTLKKDNSTKDIIKILTSGPLKTNDIHDLLPYWDKKDLILFLRELREEGIIDKLNYEWKLPEPEYIEETDVVYDIEIKEEKQNSHQFSHLEETAVIPDNSITNEIADQAEDKQVIPMAHDIANDKPSESVPAPHLNPSVFESLDKLESRIKHKVNDKELKLLVLEKLINIVADDIGQVLYEISQDLKSV